MCWASNQQNTYRNYPRAYFPFTSTTLNATGNIAKWAAELAEFQMEFQPRHAVKS
jgi:hypothetical protein